MKRLFPVARSAFLKIAEPRFIRVTQFAIYICILYSAINVLNQPPGTFERIIYPWQVYMFGGFLGVGALLGAAAVLPGIWWLERTGIIALSIGLCMYFVISSALGASPVGIGLVLAFLITFVQRWREIKGAQLAPKER